MTVKIMPREDFDRLFGDRTQTHYDAAMAYEKYCRRASREAAD